MSNNDHTNLEGSKDQVADLRNMLVAYKSVLMSIGGDKCPVDMLIEQRLQRASYWIEQCEMRLGSE